jgi:hypothetical protein
MDASGRLKCAFGSGGTVAMTIGDGTTTFYTGSCTTNTFPIGKCTYSGSDQSKFTGQTLISTVTVTYGSSVSSTANLLFQQAPTALSSYGNLRTYLSLPNHPTYQGDTFTVPIYLYSPTWAIGACDMFIYYPAGISYVPGSVSSTLYTAIPTLGAGYIRLTFNFKSAFASTTDYINIGSFQFTVSGSVFGNLAVTASMVSLSTPTSVVLCDVGNALVPCSTANPTYGSFFSDASVAHGALATISKN